MMVFLWVFHLMTAVPMVVPPAHDSFPTPLATTLPVVSLLSEPWQLVSLPLNVKCVLRTVVPRPGAIFATPESSQPKPCGGAAEVGAATTAVPRPRATIAVDTNNRRMLPPADEGAVTTCTHGEAARTSRRKPGATGPT